MIEKAHLATICATIATGHSLQTVSMKALLHESYHRISQNAVLDDINEEYLGERRSTENIEKVGLTYFFNLGKGESSSAKQCELGAEGEKVLRGLNQ